MSLCFHVMNKAKSTNTHPPLQISSNYFTLFSVCPSNTHGLNCAGTCDCVAANTKDATQTCDIVTGVCDCKTTTGGTPAWNGTRCEFDVDECATGTHGCESQPNQGCHNLNGSFECSCVLGYTRDNAGNCIQSK